MAAVLRRRWTLLLCLAACRTEPVPAPGPAPGPQVVRAVHGSLLIAESGPDTGIGITARLAQREVVCERRDREAAPIGYIVFERRGDRMAYGVYGLGLAKNPMGSGRPLDGDPIA
jgi:hypothetical protein